MNRRGMSILFLLVATYASDAHRHASGNHYNEEGDHGLLRKIKDGRAKRDQLIKDVAAESATLDQIKGPNHTTMLAQVAEIDKRDRAVDATMGLDAEQTRLLHQGYRQQKDAATSAWQQSKDAAESKLSSLQQELTTTKADIEKNEHALTDLEVRIGLYHTNTFDDFSHAPWVQVWTIPTMASRFDVFAHVWDSKKPHGSAAICPLDQSEMTGLLEKARLTKTSTGVYNQDPTAKTMQISKIEVSNDTTTSLIPDEYIWVTYKDGSRLWYKQPRGGRMRDRADTWIRGYHWTDNGHHENGHYLVDPVNKPIESYADELLILRPKATWSETCGRCLGHGYLGMEDLPSFTSSPGHEGFLAHKCGTCNGTGKVTKTDKVDQDFTYIGCRTTTDRIFGGFAWGSAGILTTGVGAGVILLDFFLGVGCFLGFGIFSVVVGIGATIGGFIHEL